VRHPLLCLLPLLAAAAGGSADAQLVPVPLDEIETTGEPWPHPCPVDPCGPSYGPHIRHITGMGGLAFFSAFDFEHGIELWATDGRPGRYEPRGPHRRGRLGLPLGHP
jgi:hypothetical protein